MRAKREVGALSVCEFSSGSARKESLSCLAFPCQPAKLVLFSIHVNSLGPSGSSGWPAIISMTTANGVLRRYEPPSSKLLWRWLYSHHHAQRFLWLTKKLAALKKTSVSIIELGCSEAKSLDYVPIEVHRYRGFDAGWGSGVKDGIAYGLEAARQRCASRENFRVQQSVDPEDIALVPEKFDIAIVMETFEYLEIAKLESYIAALAGKLHPGGCLFSTMPNEKGLALACKVLGASISRVRRSRYSASELLNAVLGRMARVPRAERGRKGFDYSELAKLVQRGFRHVHLEGIGLLKLPCALSLNVGMIASQEALPPTLID